jgi:hypothetical protein
MAIGGENAARLPRCGAGLVRPVREAWPPPLPATGADVAAFLAGERSRGLTSEGLKWRGAPIRYRHGATVATRNVSDFVQCGIAVEHPWDAA